MVAMSPDLSLVPSGQAVGGIATAAREFGPGSGSVGVATRDPTIAAPIARTAARMAASRTIKNGRNDATVGRR
jgi:hypothetical protein